ncbi:MAG TPA: hypothetical protein VFW54_10160, partial [Propionibacteriaceae bacterium]|nr:hypothetical protein [Propionibacteriaceae bacterium]
SVCLYAPRWYQSTAAGFTEGLSSSNLGTTMGATQTSVGLPDGGERGSTSLWGSSRDGRWLGIWLGSAP